MEFTINHNRLTPLSSKNAPPSDIIKCMTMNPDMDGVSHFITKLSDDDAIKLSRQMGIDIVELPAGCNAYFFDKYKNRITLNTTDSIHFPLTGLFIVNTLYIQDVDIVKVYTLSNTEMFQSILRHKLNINGIHFSKENVELFL